MRAQRPQAIGDGAVTSAEGSIARSQSERLLAIVNARRGEPWWVVAQSGQARGRGIAGD